MKRRKKGNTINVMFRDVPRNLWDHYKARCALSGVSMKDMFLSLVREALEKRLPPVERENK